jgi:hypothetical protein
MVNEDHDAALRGPTPQTADDPRQRILMKPRDEQAGLFVLLLRVEDGLSLAKGLVPGDDDELVISVLRSVAQARSDLFVALQGTGEWNWCVQRRTRQEAIRLLGRDKADLEFGSGVDAERPF